MLAADLLAIYMAATFHLDALEWPALPSLTEQATDGAQNVDSSEEVSEVKTGSEVLMHCVHFMAISNQAA